MVDMKSEKTNSRMAGEDKTLQESSCTTGAFSDKGFAKLPIIIGCIAGVLLLAYIAGVIFYKSHVFAGTSFKDISLSNCSASEIDTKLNSMLDDYTLTINGRDNMSVSFGSSDIDLRYELNEYANNLIGEQNAWAWIAHLLKKDVIEEEFNVVYDEAKLEAVVNDFDFMQPAYIKKPVNAYISEYKSGEGYSIVEEEPGNTLDTDKLYKVIGNAVKNIDNEVDLEEEGLYIDPEIKADNKKLNKRVNYLNKFVKSRITYHFGDDTVVVDGDKIYSWLKVKKNGKVEVLEDKVKAFVNEIGSKYDTIFRPRVFMTSYGKEVTIDQGDYGWWMNRSSEVTELLKLIKSGEEVEREPVYFQKAAQYGKEDYGNTYVEINLTAQHLFLYKDGQVVLESDFVSGKDVKNRKTPAGVYGITYKERDATLVGEDYETPVSYWMPFNGNVGMHDATWRNKFGSNFYKYSGSHGCINLPFYVAENIYGYIEKGTPVICYYLPGTESKSVTPQGDEEIAHFVVDAIERIGTISKDRRVSLEKTFKRIKECYKGLTANQKKYVKNYDDLAKAEKKLAEAIAGK